MNTVSLWLLVSLQGYVSANSNVPATTVARFADVQECERVRLILKDAGGSSKLMCIQARVVP
jgi:hypothetical protein